MVAAVNTTSLCEKGNLELSTSPATTPVTISVCGPTSQEEKYTQQNENVQLHVNFSQDVSYTSDDVVVIVGKSLENMLTPKCRGGFKGANVPFRSKRW